MVNECSTPESEYPIVRILNELDRRGLIANVTVSEAHVKRHAELIRNLRGFRLIHGLGVSYRNGEDLASIWDSNTIVHYIAGEHNPLAVVRARPPYPKILVLGYKRYGRGAAAFDSRVEAYLAGWHYWIGTILRMCAVVCFDNLALEQLRIKELLPADVWQRCYMGGDGQFTMYVDAVWDEFGVGSTSPRQPRNGRNAREMFAAIAADFAAGGR